MSTAPPPTEETELVATRMLSVRIKTDLLAEIDNYAASENIPRAAAVERLLTAALTPEANAILKRTPGWDAKAIARIAREYYGGLASMFDKHNWKERGDRMMPAVQRHVAETYQSVDKFVETHAPAPEDFRQELSHAAAEAGDPVKQSGQRDYMRKLVKEHSLDKETVCAKFAEALNSGQVKWKNNRLNIPAELYASYVWADGVHKGWLQD